MTTDHRSTGDEAGGAGGPDEVNVNWHRGGAGEQVVLGVEFDEVRMAVAFPADSPREDLEAVLDERDRELRHYFDALPGDADPGLRPDGGRQ